MAFNSDVKEKSMKYLEELKKHNIRILKAYLFGSFATGSNRKDSDIDIAVISPDFSGNRFWDSIKILPMRRKIDSRIEPVTFKPEDFDENDPLVSQIKNSGIELI